MANKKTPAIVPDQRTGKAIDAETSVELMDEKEAQEFFRVVQNRLQNVNAWDQLAGNISASFRLVDKNGKEVDREVQKGDYFKIDIPGPGSKTGRGYDWVQVEEIESSSSPESDNFAFRVRPTDNPLSGNQDIAHFYSHESTSTFTVTRVRNKVSAAIYDRNTKPNTDADSTTDKIRHAVVGTAGAISFSKIQWQNLTDGLVEKE